MPDPEYLEVMSDPKQNKCLRKILTERGLASYMNDTKWRELCRGVDQLPFPPAYQIKRLDADAPEPPELPFAPTYFGDWAKTWEASFGIHIEWIKIAPRHCQHRGRLIDLEIRDCSTELRGLLKELRLPFVEQDGFMTLYGHGPGIAFDLE